MRRWTKGNRRRAPSSLDAEAVTAVMRAVADRDPSPKIMVDRAGAVRYVNPATAALLGRPAAALLGLAVSTLLHPDDIARGETDLADFVDGRKLGEPLEYRVRSSSGAWATLSVAATNLLHLPYTPGILLNARDITEQRAREQSFRELALLDPITGLGNRRALEGHLQELMATERPFAVVFVDVDHIRRINDSLGHTAGDTVLRTVGRRLASSVPRGGTVRHFGADTFVMVLDGLDAGRAVQLMWQALGRLGTPLFVAGSELRLAASAGVAVRQATSTAESLLRDADGALTRAKGARRGGVEVFSETMRAAAVERLALETDLRHAIDRDELVLHAQPIVGLSDGSDAGVEALLRWTRRDGTAVSPDTFVPLAEESGLIGAIGDWVLERAVSALEAGRASRMSVNLSPRQLLDPRLPSRVETLLHGRGIAAGSLAFEVTETAVVENFELSAEVLSKLRAFGCPVGLDDFGTAYSSLGYLRQLPVDFLELDRAMVQDVDVEPQAARIAETVVALGRALGLKLIAEGLERQRQADTMAAMGCHYGQGWLFGRPVPV